MKRILVLLALAGLLCLFGCSHSRGYWTKEGFNLAEFNSDSYACEKDATYFANQSGAQNIAYILLWKDWYNRCLGSKGYNWVKAEETGKEMEKQSPRSKLIMPDLDKPFVTYPTFRIDDKIQKISIIGSGEGELQITSVLNKIFTERSNIKVIEPGNLEAVVKGKVIEYKTGLNEEDSQTLARILQVNHILLFQEEITPYEGYMNGGRCVVKINVKIKNLITGEIIYQTIHTFGAYYDPKKYGHDRVAELSPSSKDFLRLQCILYLAYNLEYAIGSWETGAVIDPNDTVVKYVIPNSLADKAGVKINDRLVEINGLKIQYAADLIAIEKTIKQGDEINVKMKRGEEVLEFNSRIPAIPFRTGENIENAPGIRY